jgi:hypothetical protein
MELDNEVDGLGAHSMSKFTVSNKQSFGMLKSKHKQGGGSTYKIVKN